MPTPAEITHNAQNGTHTVVAGNSQLIIVDSDDHTAPMLSDFTGPNAAANLQTYGEIVQGLARGEEWKAYYIYNNLQIPAMRTDEDVKIERAAYIKTLLDSGDTQTLANLLAGIE